MNGRTNPALSVIAVLMLVVGCGDRRLAEKWAFHSQQFPEQLSWFTAACGLQDGGYLVGGFERPKHDGPNNAGYRLMRFQADGALVWSRTIGSHPLMWCEVRDLAEDGRGGFYFAAMQCGPGKDDTYDWWCGRLSGHGDLLWARSYDAGPKSNDYADSLAVRQGGRIVVAGSVGDPGIERWEDAKVIAYGSTGQVLWSTQYGGPGKTNELGRGVAVDQEGTVTVLSSSGRGGLFRVFSSAGELIRETVIEHPDGAALVPCGMRRTVNGDFIVACCVYRDLAWKDRGVAVLKFDSGLKLIWIRESEPSFWFQSDAWAVSVDSEGNTLVGGDRWFRLLARRGPWWRIWWVDGEGQTMIDASPPGSGRVNGQIFAVASAGNGRWLISGGRRGPTRGTSGFMATALSVQPQAR